MAKLGYVQQNDNSDIDPIASGGASYPTNTGIVPSTSPLAQLPLGDPFNNPSTSPLSQLPLGDPFTDVPPTEVIPIYNQENPTPIAANDLPTTDITTYVEGYINDEHGNPISNASIQLIVNETGQALSDPFIVEYGNYSAWTDKNPYQIAVLFKAAGYADQKQQISSLVTNGNVTMKVPGSGAKLLIPVGLMLMVLLLVKQRQKKTGRIGALEGSDVKAIFMAVAGLIAFKLLEQILQKLGVWSSPQTKALDTLADDPTSFWNPTFWQKIPAGSNYHSPITESQAANACYILYDAFGPFNDNEEQAIGVFKQLQTQANASFISWKFSQLYGEDLLKFLRGGTWPQDRLSDADVYEINSFVTNLPKY